MARKSVSRRSKQRRVSKRNSGKKTQRGGNYYLNVGGERIGGLAEVINVNDPIAPIQGASTGEFATPLFMMNGGSKKKKSSRKSKTRKSKKNQRRRLQKGGSDAVAPYNGNGMESVFHDNMMQRDFSCKTPEWTPACL